MSATTVFVLEVAITDLLMLRKSDDLARQIGSDYCSCMFSRFGLKKEFVEVDAVPVRELSMVEIEGPWEPVCWIGASTLTIGTGVKWGVFLADSDERASVLREVACLASSFQASAVIGFGSESSAYDLAVAGALVSAVKERLESEMTGLSLNSCLDRDLNLLVNEIGEMENELERGFFEIHVIHAG